ncbi:signal peptide peptidase SppA [Chitinivibrio alkaliphilus]|uniref:Signal peptide peptidase SppA, 36K type n=1 Tax=Chitinivibrio alkaliphilus ACht1 TaxID=1313304 RepID=U7D8G4_9BACT|nr:signal peptide peptidase SppA [Chitinivibrio alkaliphilus]ERP38689.1 signal peptide peptidase SppA, 36K type [Chitinivibrio alkaliphilus ACht1]
MKKYLPLCIVLIALIGLPLLIALVKVHLFGDYFDAYGRVSPFQHPVIGVVTIDGIIMDSQDIVERIAKLERTPTVKAILVEINSPGGAVAPSQEIFEALHASTKPTVTTMQSVSASGGYYIAAGTDKIFANPSTLTGSIGVIMQLPRYDNLLNTLGVEMRVITAGNRKDAGSPYRSMSDGEHEYFQNILTETHERFIADIARGRDMDKEDLSLYAEGEIFTGTTAFQHGLIDSIGSSATAVQYIIDTLGLPAQTPMARKKEPHPLLQHLQESSLWNRVFGSQRLESGLYYLAPSLL